jgi:transposase
MGIDRSTIYGWLAQYRRGWGALKAKPLFARPNSRESYSLHPVKIVDLVYLTIIF